MALKCATSNRPSYRRRTRFALFSCHRTDAQRCDRPPRGSTDSPNAQAHQFLGSPFDEGFEGILIGQPVAAGDGVVSVLVETIVRADDARGPSTAPSLPPTLATESRPYLPRLPFACARRAQSAGYRFRDAASHRA